MIDTTHIENSILGTLILWPDRYHDINEIAYPFMFQNSHHLADYVWAAISEGEDLELGGIITDVQARKICTSSHILAITEAPAMDDLMHHAEKLREAYLIREDARRYSEAHRAILAGEEYEKVRATFAADLQALSDMVEVKPDRRGADILEAYDHLIKGLENEGMNGVPTGNHEIDTHTGGWQPGNSIIIGARPGMGKTTVALDWVYAAASAGIPTAFFSLEMTSKEVYYKLTAKKIGIPSSRLQRSDISPDELHRVWPGMEAISELPVYVFDDRTVNNTLPSIRDKARQVQREHGLGLIVIDYIQLMTGPETNREERISNISQGIKRMAKQMNVAVITLSQLSRSVEIRGGAKRPFMSDLRESGSLEQDGDLVGLLYRPEYYEIMEDEEGNSLAGKVELIISKHRMGSPTSLWLDYVDTHDSYLDSVQKPFSPGSDRPASVAIPASSRPGDEVPF